MRLFRRHATHDAAGYEVHYEHPTQPLAAAFLKAAAADDLAGLWLALSRESRGMFEGRYATRERLRLSRAAHVGEDDGDARMTEVAGPLAESVRSALGGAPRVNAMGVSAARLLSRVEAFVLLLPDVEGTAFVREDDWKPAHLLGFVYENREWKVDLGLTAVLSEEAGLPDPLGEL
ncbi:MAG: hypothetical protein E6I87_12895 [Chloroflexi bacterium]|nr:MAG: hypothetical protein E6I87_12895 [Chloroflexota bacterium]